MDSIWFKPELADEIVKSDDIFEQTPNIITDLISGRMDITILLENMGGVLTNREAENREKGMRFFTKVLQEIPKNYLMESQLNFISKFYIDRLKDNHRVIPNVLDGYLTIIDMTHFSISSSAEFFTILFREVACQSQVRVDRYNIYLIIHKLLEKNVEYMKTLGPDFVYGVISSMDGERDPRNLMFLFSFLPNFIKHIPLGHLVEEMFEVVSCYYPIDFHPSPDDPAAVSRQDLANALAPCLCAIPDFAEPCLVLLVEKLDSSLRLAKLDSFKLLSESCKTFKADSYAPFLKALWSSMNKEMANKTDDDLKMAAHEALSTLVAKLASTANTDQAFELFIKGILIAMQTVIADSKTVVQFIHATKVVLTTANASKESCIIVTKSMIPATMAFYEFKVSSKLQIACLEFLADVYEVGKHWNVLDEIQAQVKDIPRLCLTAVSQPAKEYQIAGFKNLIRVRNVLDTDLVLPFVEVLVHNVQFANDDELLKTSVETIHAIARKYPELIMDLVVKGKCDLDNLTQDKVALQKRLNLLSNLASIDDFTKIIIEEMLKLITADNNATKVVEALNESISNSSLYSHTKVSQIESDHGLIDSVLLWVLKEMKSGKREYLEHGYSLIANTIGSLPADKQLILLTRHTQDVITLCETDEQYFIVLESLYNSLHKDLYDSKFEEIMTLSLKLSIKCEDKIIRTKACGLTAHFLNKAEFGLKFEMFYELLKGYLASCKRSENICPKLIALYGWITKALIMRGSDMFMFWLQKIVTTLTDKDYCSQGAESIYLIMSDSTDHLTARQHCRISLLYKQRMFVTFTELTEKIGVVTPETKEAYLLSWAYVLRKAPKSVLCNEVTKIFPLVVDSLHFDNKDLLIVMIDVLCTFVQAKLPSVADSLQTILPRLVTLSKYVKSMDVRIKSLQCLYEIANIYRTTLLLPYKQDVLFDLAPSLDDKKRLVRNMAVRARTRLSVRRDVALVKYMVRMLRGELQHPAVLAALRLRVPNDYLGLRRRPAMLEVVSCYYPIDFHPSPDDPAAVSRQDLANALAPCLCAIPDFAEPCLVLLVEKLDSSLRLAKLDSFKLLSESCKTFNADSYAPFLKALWSSMNKEMANKTDDHLKMAAHEALSTLVAKLASTANTDQAFELFIKGILIAMQTVIADSKTVVQFIHATKVVLTTANASKESCIIVTKSMIPATMAFYEFKVSSKLQIACLEFLADVYEVGKHWNVLDEIQAQVKDIPRLCLTAVSQPAKEYQIAGFKNLIRVRNVLDTDLVLPFVEVLVHNVQFANDDELLKTSVETIHAIARKYPELIMDLVVKGKCDLDNLTQDKVALQKRLNLLSNLASIDDFTKIIIEEMLKLITADNNATKVVEALNESISNSSLYSHTKVSQIESDHGLIDSVLLWVLKEMKSGKREYLEHGYSLIANTIGSLPADKQLILLTRHTQDVITLCETDEQYFIVLESLYNSLHKDLYDSKFEEIMTLSLKLSIKCEDKIIRTKACGLTAHFLNKAEFGLKFEMFYELLKGYLASCKRSENICPKLIALYGWITKALIMRGSDMFMFWLQKIVTTLTDKDYCSQGAESIYLIMSDSTDHLTARQHCRISLLYKQRMFVTFTELTEKIGVVTPETKEAYLLSWAYVLRKAPKSVLCNEVTKIFPLVVDSLHFDNKDLLIVMIDVLCTFVQAKLPSVADSLQTILPRLVTLSKYVKSMDVRIKSLQCLYEIANIYRTTLLLPYKQDVLFDLAPSLDDKKRLVRNMAVRARTRWFLIGAPGEVKDN